MTWADLVAGAEAVRAAIDDVPADPIGAIGWATVDEERARAELDGLLAGDAGAPAFSPWLALERDADLGARRWIRAPFPPEANAPALVVLEPDTEGRLAASLVRFGEGIAVLYLGAAPPARGRLLGGAPRWGPHAIVAEPLALG
jgi:hypothetical protein